MYVKIKLKRLNNRLNIRELNSAKVKDFKRGRGNYPVKTYRVRAAETVDIRLNRLNNRLNNRLKNRLNTLSNGVGTAETVNVISKFNNKNVKNGNYLVKTYRIRLNRLNENFKNVKNVKNVKKGRGAVWGILIPILQHFFHFCHIIFDV